MISRMLFVTLVTPVLLFSANVSGKWSAAVDVGERAHTVLLSLRQQGVIVTGSIAGDGEQRSIEYGRNQDDQVTFEVTMGSGSPVSVQLKASDDALRGSVHVGSQTGTLEAKRYTGKCQGKSFTGTVVLGRIAIEREITGGATHVYQVQLNSGDWLLGRIDQFGNNFDLTYFAPDGTKIAAADGPPKGWKSRPLVAEGAGAYRLEVTAPKDAAPGCYEIAAEELQSYAERLKPQSPPDLYVSPRIAQLRRALEAGTPNAVEAFWEEVRQKGGPLVEPLAGSTQFMLVTFLWKPAFETHSVALVWYPIRREAAQFVRLGSSDVWYKTVRVRKDARIVYRIAPNTPPGVAAEQFGASAKADPLNSGHWGTASLLELPGAPAQPWTEKRDGVPAGQLTKHTLKSEILKNERSITVYTPPGYSRSNKPYPAAVVFDEAAYLRRDLGVSAPAILDNLLSEKRIPPMVAVFIGNPNQETRTRELPGNPAFVDFVAKELMPWARGQYHITSDPLQTVVAGSSFGGIASVNAGLRHPEVFGNILCQSGSFWWSPWSDPANPANRDELAEPTYYAQEFLKRPKLPLRFYMDAGSFENDMFGTGGNILELSRYTRDVLRAKGYEVTYQEFAGGHDYRAWRGTFADGLIALMGR
jgi:enterochelin esterase-like enzyme